MDFKLLYSLYLSTNKVKRLFSLVTYEENESPAMKHSKHIHGVNNLVQEINNIVQHRQECQTMEYDVQFICCSCKITDTERKSIMRKHRQNHRYDSMEPLAKKGF